jgi:hypothetical protein
MSSTAEAPLASWRDTATRGAILGAGFTQISMRDDWATVFAG